ncbi:MAG: hypothetical protein HQ567_26605, partial [Candidatus Nealsonbacteria bacterium]|nr:hypothetical protein [Candidatus Nealsonbacteria bacterium]
AELDPRAQAVLGRLAEGHQSTGRWKLSRAVWRAGEMGLKQAEPLLLGLIGTGRSSGRSPEQPMLDYCLCAALSRCGSARSIEPLRELMSREDGSPIVQRMATEAYLQLLDAPRRREIIDRTIDQLPEPLVATARSGPAELFQEKLKEYFADGGKGHVLVTLYRIDNEHVRPALIEVLRTTPLEPGWFKWLRHVFKVAELRRDGEVFGQLARRFETTRSTFANTSHGYYYGRRPPQKKTIGPHAERAFAHETRYYLRRRTWRTLKRLGDLNDADYVPMAVGVLLPFTDEDARAVRKETRHDWSSYQRGQGYRSVDTYWDRYGAYWAFCQILYGASSRYAADGGNRYFACTPPYKPGDAEPAAREEAFAKLWEAAPQGLLHLLDESRCEVVHRFAAKALRACKEFCDALDIEPILMLLRAPYEVTVDLAFELAVSRYDPDHPDRELVLALATCGSERARSKAHEWIQVHRRTFFRDADFVVELVTCRFADTRAFARESLRGAVLDEQAARVMIGRLTAAILSLGEGDDAVAADVATTMLLVFARQVRRIGVDVIRDLLKHPLAEVQLFAGQLILEHDELAAHPPDDVLQTLLAAEHATVREVGVRIIGQLPDYVLKQSIELLFSLLRSEHAEVRERIRPAVQRLIAGDSRFAGRLAEMLVEALLIPGAPEGVPTYTAELIEADFRDHLGAIPAEIVLKLLYSRPAPAQRVGALLLPTHLRAEELRVEEIVKLANNDVFAVREASWKMCRDNVERLRKAMAAAVRLLDARWDDSRDFAFTLFRESFTQEELTPSVLVAICDSVRPDVQQFGREMITQFFQEELGQEYLLKLSEHPSTAIQMFATNFLERYASGNLERIGQLQPYFRSVLSRVNQGRVAKDRVLAFLDREADRSKEAAQFVAELVARQSATCAIDDKARMIETMVKIHSAHPEIPLPLETHPVEVRDGV